MANARMVSTAGEGRGVDKRRTGGKVVSRRKETGTERPLGDDARRSPGGR